ncbi:hypothetical protein RHS04_06581, partial [Rhizoctonia solani]
MTHTQNQKRQLEDPGNIGILQAPQALKKGQKKAAAEGATKSKTSPTTILQTLLTNLTPTNVDLEGSTDIAGAKASKSTTVPKKMPLQKDKAANGAASVVASIEDPLGKRKKAPSLVAQQDNNKKAEKKKNQGKKVAAKTINKSPKATCAFLERMKATTNKPENIPQSCPAGSASGTTTSYGVTDYAANHGSQAPLSKHAALNQLICAYQPPDTTATTSVVSTALSLNSITPSKSISQGHAMPTAVKALSCSLPKKKAKATAHNLAKYSSDLGANPAELLDGIPRHLAPILTMPEPLPEPLYTPERKVPLPAIDLSAFPAAKRAKIV